MPTNPVDAADPFFKKYMMVKTCKLSSIQMEQNPIHAKDDPSMSKRDDTQQGDVTTIDPLNSSLPEPLSGSRRNIALLFFFVTMDTFGAVGAGLIGLFLLNIARLR